MNLTKLRANATIIDEKKAGDLSPLCSDFNLPPGHPNYFKYMNPNDDAVIIYNGVYYKLNKGFNSDELLILLPQDNPRTSLWLEHLKFVNKNPMFDYKGEVLGLFDEATMISPPLEDASLPKPFLTQKNKVISKRNDIIRAKYAEANKPEHNNIYKLHVAPYYPGLFLDYSSVLGTFEGIGNYWAFEDKPDVCVPKGQYHGRKHCVGFKYCVYCGEKREEGIPADMELDPCCGVMPITWENIDGQNFFQTHPEFM